MRFDPRSLARPEDRTVKDITRQIQRRSLIHS